MRNRLINLLLVGCSLVITLLALELGLRIMHGEYRWIRFLGEERTLFRSAYPSRYDRQLGWVPKVGKTSAENVWGETVTILPRGIRSNGSGGPPPDLGRPILAVGDSFTFGDEVADSETWPAQLEAQTGRPVVNGGVFGYGLDQSYLRAMLLAKIYRPRTLVFGLIPDDIDRCELSARQGAPKPYFDLADGKLVLKNIPVPEPMHEEHQDRFRAPLSRSYLVHRLMMKCCPHWWLMGITWDSFYSANRVHRKGEEVACKILGELDDLARRMDIDRVLVLIQYRQKSTPEDLARIARLKARCIPKRRVKVLDLKKRLDEIKRQDPERYKRFFDRHMTAEGNAFVATQVKEALRQPWKEK